VFASELDSELRDLYRINFPEMREKVFGDIREYKKQIPAHDVLCAGFPCQPFSKSGSQAGWADETRGTLFHEILEILSDHHPQFVILENVGNFQHHDKGNTWAIVKRKMEALSYHVRGTEHRGSGGSGLLSPHHFGYPHHRERFFIVASKDPLPKNPFPGGGLRPVSSVKTIVQCKSELSEQECEETRITPQQERCINFWNEFLSLLPEECVLPSFPIWGDEFGATYPYAGLAPSELTIEELRPHFSDASPTATKQDLLALLPSYANRPGKEFPGWKKTFIRQNRAWFTSIRKHLTDSWLERLLEFPPSLRKLEWNCQGEDRDLWKHVLQFRPSGLRAKRYHSIPALVAMTTTQIPLLGPERRFLTRVEGKRLQGLPDCHHLPKSRASAFQALGNGVHVDVVEKLAKCLLIEPDRSEEYEQMGLSIVEANAA
jgi:DNA (cytosine-5)-methyltransferase 1